MDADTLIIVTVKVGDLTAIARNDGVEFRIDPFGMRVIAAATSLSCCSRQALGANKKEITMADKNPLYQPPTLLTQPGSTS
jgi:hypothetical protein